MRYAQIRELDISNGEGVGVALFVQGCRFACKNCFNPETWDFNGGKEWTPEVEDKFIELASRPYIKRLSILGGDPLMEQNLEGVLHLVNRFRLSFPSKSIWIYSGYEWNDIWEDSKIVIDDYTNEVYEQYKKRQQIISQCTVMIDGRYIDSQRNPQAKWRGSDNQRVIDIQQSIKQNNLVLYCD